MKIATLVLGFLTFSLVVTIMFSAVQSYLTLNDFSGAEEWESLSVDYGGLSSSISTDSDSTLRQVDEQTKQGDVGSKDRDITLITGAVSGGRLLTNFYTNFQNVTAKVAGDTETFVPREIINAVLGILAVIVILSVIFFLRGFKAET